MTATTNVEYAIRWAESLPVFNDISRVFDSREVAEATLAETSFAGTIICREVVTTEWVDA